jgi:hypothetical protein
MAPKLTVVYKCKGENCFRVLRDNRSETMWHWSNYYAVVHSKPRQPQGALCLDCWNKAIADGDWPLGYTGLRESVGDPGVRSQEKKEEKKEEEPEEN